MAQRTARINRINRIVGNVKRDILKGTRGRDRIWGLDGNDLLIGGNGSDRLDGGRGQDLLRGGRGDDIYIVDHLKDRVQESPGQGIDTVQATVTHSLAAHLENLTLRGNGDLNGTGNDLANILIGNRGNNILDGKAGADTLIGGMGNDIYYVDDAKDTVVEAANSGTDKVITTIASYSKPANVEIIEYVGQGNFTFSVQNQPGAGSSAGVGGSSSGSTVVSGGGNDTLIGSIGNDILEGGLGNDLLSGGLGADKLIGGAGADKLIGGAGIDTLTGGTGVDTFALLETVASGLEDIITDFDPSTDILALKESTFGGLLGSQLGLVDGTVKTLPLGLNGLVGTAASTLSPYLFYDTQTGQLKIDGNGSLIPGLGNGGVLASLKGVGAMPSLKIMLDSSLN